MEDIIVRLARSCAHGVRQMELVNELLVGPAKIVIFYIPGKYGQTTAIYGEAQVGAASFTNLKRRLVQNGFFFVRSKDDTKIEMRFSR